MSLLKRQLHFSHYKSRWFCRSLPLKLPIESDAYESNRVAERHKEMSSLLHARAVQSSCGVILSNRLLVVLVTRVANIQQLFRARPAERAGEMCSAYVRESFPPTLRSLPWCEIGSASMPRLNRR